jgi:hypothetical protein
MRRALLCPLPPGFFSQLTSEDLESRYYDILEEQFLLKSYGEMTLFEQQCLTAEDRLWWIERIKKKIDDENKQAQNGRD